VAALEKKDFSLKPILAKAVKYLKFTILFTAVATVGILMGEKSLIQKNKLDEKRLFLQRENRSIEAEIKSLERRVTLLGSDPKTIARAAQRKLGMAGPDERVYIFERSKGSSGGITESE
jgi:cell division protein FtsB